MPLEETLRRPRQLSLRKKAASATDDVAVREEAPTAVDKAARKQKKIPSEVAAPEDDSMSGQVEGEDKGEQKDQSEEQSKSAKRRPLMGGTYEEGSRLSDRGIILISHLPPGFLEPQLRKFFNQFGDITRLRLIRSKKTGGSKSYAFIEFSLKEVAEIACQTMNGYMMFGRTLKCRTMTYKDIPKGLFSNYIKFPKRGYSVDKARQRYNQLDSELTEAQASHKLEKEAARTQKIKSSGIDYEPPTLLRHSSK